MPLREFEAPRSEAWVANARAWLASPGEPLVPRGAATVMVVRDSADGPMVFVQRRVASMAFAPSMYVFPGGGVDDADASAELDGTAVAALAERMALGPSEAQPLVAAAVREVEEECGLRLSAGELVPRAHWVTPPFEKRRYDTWFFAAALPEGQSALGDSGETDHDAWVLPARLLTAYAEGRAVMLPPTVVMLEQLATFGSVAEFLADEPSLAVVSPELVDLGDRLVMRSNIP
ncbi:NUDIX domain-containing protein [Knoellia remsis]|uniref:NUDIX domain-containing protein n=1 Tax=Knoellia remsis TaxID=407159 RepID=A0A2T0UNG4_9MICO|nr:NUDIX hydrolase [Knoellia remsis]PRY59462.1 NUDIX domain-containing protein [Knoellia remsis]